MTTEWHQIAGRWKQCSGANLKKRWGGLTYDERMMMKGNREVLAGTIQERFGVTESKVKKPTDVRADKLKV